MRGVSTLAGLSLHPIGARAHLKAMLRPILAALTLAACATAPEPASPVGRLYHYVRSNQDGALPEQIYLYRASEARVEVGKIVARCANAAFVTADLDLARGQGARYVGGRIGEDGSQQPFAYLDYNAQTRELHARVEQAGVDQRAAVVGEPFILYDFDLSDLNAIYAGRPAPRADFRFVVELIWPDPSAASVFRDLGWADARFAAAERHLHRDALRYEVSGGLNGQLWLDAREGHVLEARFAEPNHAEYADFRLVLQSIDDDGEASWRELRQAHWRDCP
jgi:hypothetical protein